MGWASYLEDHIKRLETSIHMAESTFESELALDAQQRKAGLAALAGAKAIIAQAWQHLDLATSPELDAAHALLEANRSIKLLEGKVAAEELQKERFERKAAESSAELVDANNEIDRLNAELKKSEKLVSKLMADDFGSAVDAFTSENRIKKHKPDQ